MSISESHQQQTLRVYSEIIAERKSSEFQSEHFINRELSWLEFNARVLEEAEDGSTPLLERVKFLAIFSSNLDEFFMVRVAGLRAQLEGGVPQDINPDGLAALEQLRDIRERTSQLVAAQYACYREVILPALAEQGIRVESFEVDLMDRHAGHTPNGPDQTDEPTESTSHSSPARRDDEPKQEAERRSVSDSGRHRQLDVIA